MKDSNIAVLTLNEPDKGNAMTARMVQEFPDMIEEIKSKSSIQVLIVTGAGDHFCTGADFTTLPELNEDTNQFDKNVLDQLYDTFVQLLNVPVPTIAAINGSAVGGGLAIALLCDLRIIAEDAKIGGNFPKLGIHPGLGISHFLPQEVGFQEAVKMSLTGDLIKGKKAEELGLALESTSTGTVMEQSLSLAKDIAKNAPLSLKEITNTYRELKTEGLTKTLDMEARAQAFLFQTEDAMEGISAMMENREPNFKGS